MPIGLETGAAADMALTSSVMGLDETKNTAKKKTSFLGRSVSEAELRGGRSSQR